MKKKFAQVLIPLLIAFIIGTQIGKAAQPENFQLKGKLTFDPTQVPSADYEVGDFVVKWRTENGGQLTVESKDRPGFAVWQTIPGEAFVMAARAKTDIKENRGMFDINYQWTDTCTSQEIQSIGLDTDMPKEYMGVGGKLICASGNIINFGVRIGNFGPDHKAEINFGIGDPKNLPYIVYINYAKDKDEHFFGFGEQFTHFDMTGLKVPMWVSEQGVGRGEQPITFAADVTNGGAGGNDFTTYAPMPFYVTSKMRALRFVGYPGDLHYSTFDLRSENSVQIATFMPGLDIQVFTGETPKDILEKAGRKPIQTLPDWIYSGAVIGMQGGTDKVHSVFNELEKRDTPIAAFWLQDWVGQRTTSFGKQLWWNWELDTDRYPNWDNLVADLNEKDIRILLYINPNLADVSEKTNARRNLFKEALEKGYLIQKKDGTPYLLRNTSFDYGMLDLSNPDALDWIADVMKENMLGIGASGWMADFGESLPTDAVLSNEAATLSHNEYPSAWLSVNYTAFDQNDKQPMFFMRSGYIDTVPYTPLFWEGDQLVDWSAEDGIKSAVTGLNTSGLSGMAFNHSDIGGYTTISNPVLNIHRSRELLYRWMEMNAFTLIFRTHEGNQPDNNVQFYTDDETLDTFAYWVKVYAALFEYRKSLVKEATETGLPVVRHPFIQYPDDPETWKITYQEFMLGADFLIAPVTDEGAAEVTAYLPAGTWTHLWSGNEYQGGQYVTVPAPIGKPGVFYLTSSHWGREFAESLKTQGLMP